MKKLLSVIFVISVFTFISCKNPTNPEPLTLAERAGTYSGTGVNGYLPVVNINAIGEVRGNEVGGTPTILYTPTLDPTSQAFIFTVNTGAKNIVLTFISSTKISLYANSASYPYNNQTVVLTKQ